MLHVQAPLCFPDDAIDTDARALISELLVRDVPRRLGCGPGGDSDLKQHTFFSDLGGFDALLVKEVWIDERICCQLTVTTAPIP